MPRGVTSVLALGLCAGVGLGCQGDTSAPEAAMGPGPSSLEIAIATTGTDLDPDGYTVTLDQTKRETVAVNGIVTFSHVSPGSRVVELGGVARSCAPEGRESSHRREVLVVAGRTSRTQFTIRCGPDAAFADTAAFRAATAELGDAFVIDFDDLDAGPVTNTFDGRPVFDGAFYADQGFRFANPKDFPLYIAPGGLFWNASNSLSVWRFPFDSAAEVNEDDDLLVILDPPCRAVSLVFVDVGSNFNEFVEFTAPDGELVRRVILPPLSFEGYRSFLGVISEDKLIGQVNVVEAAGDDDDVNFDDVTCIGG